MKTATPPELVFRVAGQEHRVWWSALLAAWVCGCGRRECAGVRRALAAMTQEDVKTTNNKPAPRAPIHKGVTQ